MEYRKHLLRYCPGVPIVGSVYPPGDNKVMMATVAQYMFFAVRATPDALPGAASHPPRLRARGLRAGAQPFGFARCPTTGSAAPQGLALVFMGEAAFKMLGMAVTPPWYEWIKENKLQVRAARRQRRRRRRALKVLRLAHSFCSIAGLHVPVDLQQLCVRAAGHAGPIPRRGTLHAPPRRALRWSVVLSCWRAARMCMMRPQHQAFEISYDGKVMKLPVPEDTTSSCLCRSLPLHLPSP